ncbi:MAG: hypothetical protein QNJ90_05080 [Planctomycetota bacterium]|nr:hypothetical protein [Planctomycetota bacterium]
MSIRNLALILLVPALLLCACGGGGGGDDQDNDENPVVGPLALLEGSWKGTGLLSGEVGDVTIDGQGVVTEFLLGGVPEVFEGTFRHVTGKLYAITVLFENGQVEEWRLLLDATDTYAVFLSGESGSLFALQRGATTVLPRTFDDYAPRVFQGQAVRLDAALAVLGLGGCTLNIGGDLEFLGGFGALSFLSEAGSPLAFRFPNGTVINGPCQDDDATTNVNQLYIVSFPDGSGIAFGAFDPGAGRHVYFGVLAQPDI